MDEIDIGVQEVFIEDGLVLVTSSILTNILVSGEAVQYTVIAL